MRAGYSDFQPMYLSPEQLTVAKIKLLWLWLLPWLWPCYRMSIPWVVMSLMTIYLLQQRLSLSVSLYLLPTANIQITTKQAVGFIQIKNEKCTIHACCHNRDLAVDTWIALFKCLERCAKAHEKGSFRLPLRLCIVVFHRVDIMHASLTAPNQSGHASDSRHT
jgi:hypothetical protein